MKTVATFVITPTKYFEVTVPELENKSNYHYEPTASLDLFDEVSLVLKCDNSEFKISSDTVEWILSKLNKLNKISELPKNIKPGDLGKSYNQNMYLEDFDSLDFENYWLWSGTEIQVWIYSKNEKFYLEVSSTYSGIFSDEKNDTTVFNNFIENYTPILLVSLSDKILQKWINQANILFKEAEDHHKNTHV